MSGHTPGPWEIIGHADDDECRIRQSSSVRMGDGFYSEKTICEEITRMADANLIAAAPDLLKALEAMVFLAIDGDYPNGRSLKAARTAIARAKGEQP